MQEQGDDRVLPAIELSIDRKQDTLVLRQRVGSGNHADDEVSDAGEDPESVETFNAEKKNRRFFKYRRLQRHNQNDVAQLNMLLGRLGVPNPMDFIMSIFEKEGDEEEWLRQKRDIKQRKPARAVISPMNWRDWQEGMGESTREDHAAIDMLCGDYQGKWRVGKTALLDKPSGSTSAKLEIKMNKVYDDTNTKPAGYLRPPLPGRIRINSAPVKRLLDGLCDDELNFWSETSSLVIARPYKLLTLLEHDIRALLAEKVQLFESRAHEFSNESHRGHVTNGETNIYATAIDDNFDDGIQHRKFPRDMIFFTGTASVVNFYDLWHLFSTGCHVYVRGTGTTKRVWRVIQATGGRKYLEKPQGAQSNWEGSYSPFVLDCYHLDYDGARFVRVHKRFQIQMFEGSIRPVTLPVMPIRIAEKEGLLSTETLSERGGEFLEYTVPQHRYYQGTTVTYSTTGDVLYRREKNDISAERVFKERVESQVMIDFERGIQANPEWAPVSSSLDDLWQVETAEIQDEMEDVEHDNMWDTRASDEFLISESKKWMSWDKGESKPSGDDLLLLPNRVIGYVLRTRTWACLKIESSEAVGQRCLLPVGRHEDPWQDLELPEGHRDIVQSLINTHFTKVKPEGIQFDLVRDKGKGVIILLHGVPGVGKTATAECIAASSGKPLLPITCGDLGLKPKEVEATIQTAFQLAQAWDCIMLLDEADIFLTQRGAGDTERNALVSVFLRILEYYEGILFLTTNRVGDFDEAFKSRVHMALYYPPLNWPATEKIWQAHIRRAQESVPNLEIDTSSLIEFAQTLFTEQEKNLKPMGHVWNGRQIRNAFQSAIALAQNKLPPSERIKVDTQHFKKVADVSNDFNHYIWRTKSGRSDADMSKEAGARDDRYKPIRHPVAVEQIAHHHPPPATTVLPRSHSPNPYFAAPQAPSYVQTIPMAPNGMPHAPGEIAPYGGMDPNQGPQFAGYSPGYGQPARHYSQGQLQPLAFAAASPQAPSMQQYQQMQHQTSVAAQGFPSPQGSQSPLGQSYGMPQAASAQLPAPTQQPYVMTQPTQA